MAMLQTALPVGCRKGPPKNGSRTKTKPGCYWSDKNYSQKGANEVDATGKRVGEKPFPRHIWAELWAYHAKRGLAFP